MARIRHIVVALLAMPALASCAGVLGIETAELDPSLGGAGGSSGAGGAAGSAGKGGKGGADAGPAPVSCAEYCDAVQKNCTPADPAAGTPATQVYISTAACLAVCKTLPLGTRDDTSGNTVGCRLHYATSASTVGEKEANCSAAGPGGNSVCGTNCDGFCAIVQATCSGIYASERACNSKLSCGVLPDRQTYNDTMTSGDSVQCRLYHASAATVDPALHCPHVEIGWVGPCGPAR
jgi:hypothetical protein